MFTDDIPDGTTDTEAGLKERFGHAIHGLEKPQPGQYRQPFRNITNEERRRRELLIRECVSIGMAAEQMVDFLPTWDCPLSRSQIYDYLSEMRLPRSYRKAERDQSHHDYYTLRFFIRLAQDAAQFGYRTSRIIKGKSVEGMRFKPDLHFMVQHYKFFVETQLSDLSETRWSKKFWNYIRLSRLRKERFRVLFIIDQHGDMSYIRRAARQALQKNATRDLFLFTTLDQMKGSKNTAVEPIWLNSKGEQIPMLLYLVPR